MDLDLRTLRNFVAIVDAGSMTRAATLLHIAQPALSAQVKRLESVFGHQLLERSNSGVKPTDAGQRLYNEARSLLADAEALRGRLAPKADSAPGGDVRLGMPLGLLRMLALALQRRVQQHCPAVRLHYASGHGDQLLPMLREGRADLVLLVDTPDAGNLHWRPLAEEPMAACGLNVEGLVANGERYAPYALRDKTLDDFPTMPFAQVMALPHVVLGTDTTLRRRLDSLCAQRGITPNYRFECDTLAEAEAIYSEGGAFTISGTGHRTPVQDHPDHVRARIVDPEMVRTIGVAWRRATPLSGASRAVITHLRAVIRDTIDQRRWLARSLDRDDYRFD